MKAVVLLSGGIDSTTCLAGAIQTFGAEEVTALTLFYGQKHNKELASAKAVAEHFGVSHLVKDLSDVFSLTVNNPLLGQGEMPKGSYAEQLREENGMALTYVPFRNGLFLSYATAIAYSIGAGTIYYGAHADDAAGNAYPDCSQNFYAAMSNAIGEGTSERVQLEAPLIHMNKADVIAAGLELGAPYHLSWSCYEGNVQACGTCGTCIDRKEAFKANGFEDPIPYEG
jgi:7-cyano-7-deazaguanine synthase